MERFACGDAQVTHGDCLSGLATLKANSIDLIATDPPYFLDGMDDEWSHAGLVSKRDRATTVKGLPVGMRFDPTQGPRLQEFFHKVAIEAHRVLKPGAFMLVFSQPRLVHHVAMAAENANFEIRDMLVWEHQGGQGKAFSQDHFVMRMAIPKKEKSRLIDLLGGRKTPQLRPKFESIVVAQKPKDGTFVANWLRWQTGLVNLDEGPQPTTVFAFNKPRRETFVDHMTVKPVELMQRLIEVFSAPSQVVLDPFTGSGTTALAAVKTSRRFIGFEIEKKYVTMTMRRLAALHEPPSQGRSDRDPSRRAHRLDRADQARPRHLPDGFWRAAA